MKTKRIKITAMIMAIILVLLSFLPALAAPGDTILVSQSSSAIVGNAASEYPSISGDGRFIAFDSLASNLSPSDNNIDKRDVFVKDISTGEIMLISMNTSASKAGNNHSAKPSISADGRFTAFESLATNLDPATCYNGFSHIYVHDRETQAVTCVSVYFSQIGNIIQANGNSYRPSISVDGRYIAFSSEANKLVDGDSNDVSDIFVHDRDSGETKLVSKGWDGNPANEFSYGAAISGNGRYIAFTSMADNLVEGYTSVVLDVFRFDQESEETVLVSKNTAGDPGNYVSQYPSISFDGRFIVFESISTNLVSDDNNDKSDVFLRDLLIGVTSRVSVTPSGHDADDHSYRSVISSNGKYVSFESDARNLILEFENPIRDIFLYEIQTAKTSLVTVASDGTRSTHDCFSPSISVDGHFVAFSSEVFYFADDDSNSASDIFRHENQIINVSSDFSATPTSGFAPLQVHFTNLSVGDFVNCDWDFGDGNTNENCNNPSHTYQAVGVYTVKLTVSGPGGTDTRTRKEYINVAESPPVAAEFEATPTSGNVPLTVNFTNQSTGDYDTCLWEFGDGNSSDNCNNPSHTYQAVGVYTVKLTVSRQGGTDTRTRKDYITVSEGVGGGHHIFLPLILR